MSYITRGGGELSPSEFGGPQIGGIMVQGGRRRRGRSGKRSGSKRSGSKRRGSKRRGSRRMRGGNTCGGNPMQPMSGGNYNNPLGMSRSGGMSMPSMYGGMGMELPGMPGMSGGMSLSDMPSMPGMSGGMDMPSIPGMPSSMPGGMLVTPPSGGSRPRTRRLRKLSGKARRHRTKSYSAGGKKTTGRRK